MGGDDDLVRAVFVHRVLQRLQWIGIHDGTPRRYPGFVEKVERAPQTTLGGRTAAVLIDHEPGRGLVLRAHDGDPDWPLLCPLPQRLEQRPSGHCLVGEHEDVSRLPRRRGFRVRVRALPAPTFSRSGASARSPLKTAWLAPRTPYSYGPPTTCGISSKLKIGGGEDTCHSRVSERQGFAGAGSPKRQLVIML